jgi:DNA-binding response OmpR family regulator
VELDLAAAVLAENAIEDDEVVVRVDVEGGAEAMRKPFSAADLCERVRKSLNRPASRQSTALRK